MLSWKVLNWDSSKNKIVDYEIFGKHYEEELKKARKSKKFIDRESLKNYLKRDFQYHYWSRAECEISVGPLWNINPDNAEIENYTMKNI